MIEILKKKEQSYGEFNNGAIIEHKPIGFPQEDGGLAAYSSIFYWAYAKANKDSTIGLHPHKGFEIITIVLSGRIKHYDTLLNKWITLEAGGLQFIQAGKGISHAEHLFDGAEIFQIWLDPNLSNSLSLSPNYQDYSANNFTTLEGERYLAGKNSPTSLLTPDIEIVEKTLACGQFQMAIEANYYYSLYLISGEMQWDNQHVVANDFIRIHDESLFTADITKDSRLLYIKSPITPDYKTYA